MTRTERSHHHGGGGKTPRNASNTAAARRSSISRSLSKLLRHQAENEKIPISAAGWVKLDDLLAWRGLERIEKGITVTEIFEVVEEDGRTGKGRFEVKYVGEQGHVDDDDDDNGAEDAETEERETVNEINTTTSDLTSATSSLTVTDPSTPTLTPTSEPTATPMNPTSKNTPQTQTALHHHTLHPTTPATAYLIRATQGHSIKTVTNTSTLTALLPTDSSLPSTVVHGTFYGAWPSILRTGGLKPMGRNNVHFATGPSLEEVVARTQQTSSGQSQRQGLKAKSQVEAVLNQNKVVSGMRWDAQLLIYVDLKGALEDVAARGLDMSWWISGNGVVLTEGVIVDDNDDNDKDEGEGGGVVTASTAAKVQKEAENLATTKGEKTEKGNEKQRIVPMKYWTTVVEIKNGMGVIWRRGEGVVKELPERLRNMPVPAGKARGHGSERGRGRMRGSRGGGKPRLNVERGNVDRDETVGEGEED